jgi:hypothetical protein
MLRQVLSQDHLTSHEHVRSISGQVLRTFGCSAASPEPATTADDQLQCDTIKSANMPRLLGCSIKPRFGVIFPCCGGEETDYAEMLLSNLILSTTKPASAA